MRILQVTPGYYPDVGGVERHVQALSESLMRLGHDVAVVTMAHKKGLPNIERVEGVEVRRLPALGPQAYRVPIGLFHHLRQHALSFDVIHAHNYNALPLLLAVVACRQRTIITPNSHSQGHSLIGGALHVAYDPIAVPMLQWAGCTVCLSSGEAEVVAQRLRIPRQRITIIPSGITVPTEYGKPNGRRQGCLLLSVGRLEAYKRVDRLITALQYLPQEFALVVIGAGSERGRLEQIAAQLGVQRRVRFLGRVSDEELRQWYLRARVVVSFSEAESFGITLLEGLAAGCEVVCNDIPAFRDFAVEYPQRVSLVSSAMPGEEVAKLLGMVTTKPASCPVNLHRYLWPEVTSQLLKVYGAVAERANGA